MRRMRIAAPAAAIGAATLAVAGLAAARGTAPQEAAAPAAEIPKYGALFAVLLGGNEVGSDGKANAGDPDGEGSFAFQTGAGANPKRLCFGLTVKAIGKPTAAHIHRAFPGSNGPVVITLKAPAAGNPGTSSGCVRARTSLLKDILHHPLNYYVNVHTAQYPDGALRGHLF